jgi:lycopene cyclase domain-containing protein
MTYLQFHGVFILPLLVGAALWARSELRIPLTRWALAGLCLLAFTYATPWDNYLLYKQVWMYSPERVIGTLGYVPLEEYAFFILQTLLMGCIFLASTRPSRWQPLTALAIAPPLWGGAALAAMLTTASALLLGHESSFYLGLILVWAFPVLGLQWLAGGDILRYRWRQVYLPAAAVTAYLWACDAYALSAQIWLINPRYILNVQWGVLPIEEMIFFLVTNLMVCQGLALCLEPAMLARLQTWLPTRRAHERP